MLCGLRGLSKMLVRGNGVRRRANGYTGAGECHGDDDQGREIEWLREDFVFRAASGDGPAQSDDDQGREIERPRVAFQGRQADMHAIHIMTELAPLG